jgi:VWFA-related protein
MMRSSVETPNWALVLSLALAASASAQAPPSTFKSKVNLVMVPVVVRDRDGRPVGNLTQDDFQLSDSGRKQVITKFSVEKAAPEDGQKPAGEAKDAGVRAPESTTPRFVALVFDDLNLHTGGMGDFGQGYFTLAREAARRYVARLNPADRVAVFATSGHGSLDFTSDRAALEQALLKLRTTPNPSAINGSVFDPNGAMVEMQSRLSVQALQVMSRRLAGLPGPRVMVLLSPGFSLPPELVSVLWRAIDVAVASGVVINVLNVRGLEARVPEAKLSRGYTDAPARDLEAPLAQLADGTGGAYIHDTNDYDGALHRLAAKPEYLYLLGFEPDDLKQDGRLHSLKVTLKDSHGLNVQARRGYLDPKPGTEAPEAGWAGGFVPVMHGALDLSNPQEKELETVADSPAAASGGASIALPFFYRGPNVARVDMALDIPSASFEPVQTGGKLQAELAVLGLVYTPAGKVAARFSDKAHFEFATREQFDEFARQPLHYEHQFDVAAGKYNFKVVYRSAKDRFGKVEAPLGVDPWDGRKLGLSAIALSHEVEVAPATDEALDEGPQPLVFRGMQIVVSGTDRLRQDGLAEAYLEVYESKTVQVELRLRLLDDRSGDQKWDSGNVNLSGLAQAGNPVIPVALRLPVSGLAPGFYRAEFTVHDSSGATAVRESRFQLE